MSKIKGVIKSITSTNSVVVAVEYIFRHPKYKKNIRKTTKIAAHNEIEGLKKGDKVLVVKSRPYSKTKHFRVTEVIL